MKATIKIPAGWRRLRNRVSAKGDKYLCRSELEWRDVPDNLLGSVFPALKVIRRIARAKKWVPNGYEPLAYTKWLAIPIPGDDESLAYSRVGERKLIPYSKIMFMRAGAVRFFLLKWAK